MKPLLLWGENLRIFCLLGFLTRARMVLGFVSWVIHIGVITLWTVVVWIDHFFTTFRQLWLFLENPQIGNFLSVWPFCDNDFEKKPPPGHNVYWFRKWSNVEAQETSMMHIVLLPTYSSSLITTHQTGPAPALCAVSIGEQNHIRWCWRTSFALYKFTNITFPRIRNRSSCVSDLFRTGLVKGQFPKDKVFHF